MVRSWLSLSSWTGGSLFFFASSLVMMLATAWAGVAD